jgi:hypothetical protein
MYLVNTLLIKIILLLWDGDFLIMAESFMRIEKAILQQDINKYYPGTATFTLPSLAPSAVDYTESTQRLKSANKNSTFTTSSYSLSATISLPIPKSILHDYKTKIVPAGTVFLVAFVGGNMTVPTIIGMG